MQRSFTRSLARSLPYRLVTIKRLSSVAWFLTSPPQRSIQSTGVSSLPKVALLSHSPTLLATQSGGKAIGDRVLSASALRKQTGKQAGRKNCSCVWPALMGCFSNLRLRSIVPPSHGNRSSSPCLDIWRSIGTAADSTYYLAYKSASTCSSSSYYVSQQKGIHAYMCTHTYTHLPSRRVRRADPPLLLQFDGTLLPHHCISAH